MKNIILTYTSLLILLNLHYLGQVDATQHEQQGWWHEPLAELYYKGVSQMNRKETRDIIQIFEGIHNTHIKKIQDIHSEIKPKMLDKRQFSSKKYELDVLTVFYLFKKIDNRTPLIQGEIQQGYQALTKLYYKGTSKKQENKPPIQQIPKNKTSTKHQGYALDLAQYLNNHSISPDQLQQPLPITVQQAPRYSHPHNNLTTQLHNLKTTLSNSPSKIALLHIDSLDRVPSLEIHSSDEEDSKQDTKDYHNTHLSSPTRKNNNYETDIQQVIQEQNDQKNRLNKLNKLNKQLTTHSIHKHDQSLTCSDTNPESHTSEPFTKQPNTLHTHPSQPHHTPILSTDDLQSEALNQLNQKYKKACNQIKEAKQEFERKQQIIEGLEQKIKNMQQEASQDKTTVQDLKTQITDLQQQTKQSATTSPNIITHVLALVVGTIMGIAINKYIPKTKQKENEKQLVSGKEDNISKKL